jgi:uncharacterized protein (DUF983 family)
MYCRKCDRELPLEAFGTRKTPTGEIIPRLPCKECGSKSKKERWALTHPVDPAKKLKKEQTELRRAEKRQLKAEGKKRCTVCGEIKFLEEFAGYSARCVPCDKQARNALIRKHKEASGFYKRKELEAELRRLKAEEHERTKRIFDETVERNKALLVEGQRWCPHCQKALLLESFGKRSDGSPSSWCKVCSAPLMKAGQDRYRERQKQIRHEMLHLCVQCGKMVAWEEYVPSMKKCRDCLAVNKELQRQRKQAKKREQKNARIKEDGAYRLQRRISENLRAILHNEKSGSSAKWTGCSRAFLKEYIASKFTEGMTWDNYGDWHLDHIIPQAFFDFHDPEQVRICWNYRNLQPLWRQDNIDKSDSLPEGFEQLLTEIKAAFSP